MLSCKSSLSKKGGLRLRVIRRRIYIFAAFTGFSILTGAMLLVFGETKSEIMARIFLAMAIIAGAILAGFCIREFNKLKIAQLVVDNPILHICTAIIGDISGEAGQQKDMENTEMFISYFGILLDANIIKFNQDGIRLRAMEIGPDFISFTYGTEKRMQNIRLLRPQIDPAVLDGIIEKFRYETGITPSFIS